MLLPDANLGSDVRVSVGIPPESFLLAPVLEVEDVPIEGVASIGTGTGHEAAKRMCWSPVGLNNWPMLMVDGAAEVEGRPTAVGWRIVVELAPRITRRRTDRHRR